VSDTHATPSPARGTVREPLTHEQLRARIADRFGDAVTSNVERGELTFFVPVELLVEVVAFCRDDPELSCEMLSDLSGVHWPAGEHVVVRQVSTTGWPDYRVDRERGVIEVGYVLRSVTRNHVVKLSVGTDDEDPQLPSVTHLYPTANYHEREVFDFFGVEFAGHPNLRRILMPDDWLGHPHRKDYPLGGVDIPYKNDKHIPPPDERDLREVVE
jgi:NADH-quinone oxidoreductase subunit C